MIITIDGPMASGKSSVARTIAHELQWYFLSTGLLYRGLAYLLLEQYGYTDVQLVDPSDVHLADCFGDNFAYRYDAQLYERFIFKGVDITPQLKNNRIDQGASLVSTNLRVRAMLTHVQRLIAAKNNVVIEGRDSGSVVFPYAEYKFFLTANPEIRAERWCNDQLAKGRSIAYEWALQELLVRDERDRKRAQAPLVVPEGAQIIDSSALSQREVVEIILRVVDCGEQADNFLHKQKQL